LTKASVKWRVFVKEKYLPIPVVKLSRSERRYSSVNAIGFDADLE